MTIYTESAGGIIVSERGNAALVKNGPFVVGFPKGRVDDGEKPLDAAIREIEEETGLREISLVRPLGSYGRYKGSDSGRDEEDKSEYKTIHMFLFAARETALAPKDEGNPEAFWVPLDGVERRLTYEKDRAFFRSVRPICEEATARLRE